MSNKPDFLDELINRASKAAGNDAQLAKRLAINRQRISQWRNGYTTCPAADVALMASVAGLDAEAWGARALIAQHEGTEKGKLLQQALKKALAATGAALGLCGSAAAQSICDFIRCIESKAKAYQIHKVNGRNLIAQM